MQTDHFAVPVDQRGKIKYNQKIYIYIPIPSKKTKETVERDRDGDTSRG